MEKNDQQHLLVNMDKKKIMEPARLTLVVDSKEVREYFLEEERYVFYEGYKKKLLRREQDRD